jgi:excisionase family DNA binding protein
LHSGWRSSPEKFVQLFRVGWCNCIATHRNAPGLIMLTVRDVMNRFGVTQGTVLGWIRSGELKAVNVGRSPGKKKPRWRISSDAIVAFEASRAAAQAPAPKQRPRRSQPDVVEFYS